jgi:diadenylate cyclase
MTEWESVELILRLLLDVVLVWMLIYAGMRIVRNNNRTIQIVKGILVLFLIKLLSVWLQLTTVSYLLDIFLNWGVIFVLVILQPEIRSMLEKIGNINTRAIARSDAAAAEAMVDEIVEAVENMSKTKTGALITIEMNQSLEDFEKTGIPMDSMISSQLLETLFQYGSPTHDGAVTIKDGKIACSACYLPTTTKDLPSKYGARHRAAVGVSEVTDSITLVVSEETGSISVASKGILTQYNPQALKRYLNNILVPERTGEFSSVFAPVRKTVDSFASTLQRNKAELQQQRKDGAAVPNPKTEKQPEKQDVRVNVIETIDLAGDEDERR